MRARVVTIVAGREIRSAIRGRWFIVGALSLALLSIAVASLGMAGAERWGVSMLDRTAVALLDLVLLFIPLLGLPLGAGSFAGEEEDGSLAYMVAQPVTRAEVFVGKLAGLIATMTLSLSIGFGSAAVVVGLSGGVPTVTFLALTAGAWLLAVVTVTLGALLSVLARRRVRALAAAIATWVVLVFLCDFGVLATASSEWLSAGGLFAIAVANPVEAVKTLSALAISERLEVLGPVGVHAVRVLGRAPLSALLASSVLAWTALSAGAAYLRFRKESLT
jgi:Cu-processing system permease protein